MWRPDLEPVLVRKGAEWRWPRAGEVVVCTYGVLPDPEDVPTPGAAVRLIADEAHLLKNSKATRSKRWKGVRDAAFDNGGTVWLLTGTPLVNRPPELWSVLGAAKLQEEAFGSWRRFCALFSGVRGRFGYTWGSAADDVPFALQKVSLHRRRTQVLPDLPTKRYQTIEVSELPASVLRACDQVVDALRAKGIDLDGLPANADLGKLISGPVFELMSRARAQLAAAKVPAALELVEGYEEAEEPLVVVSAHREPVDTIGAREGWAAITGDTSPEERGRICERFQAGELRGVALTYRAGGVGITLTRASHVLLVDLDWTPALIQQAEDRVCRIGQTRGVLVQRIVAEHPLDERVSELLAEKAALIAASVEASAVEADHVHASPAVALAEAAQAAAATVAGVPVLPPPGPTKTFRPAASAMERWAAEAIVALAAMDPDHAAELNDVGFNRNDNDFGHSLAASLTKYGRLSDRQWECAVRLARKYSRQVGSPPAQTTEVA